MNCHEVQDENKPFHYVWFLLSIVMVTWELPEDNYFPPLKKGLLEATSFASF